MKRFTQFIKENKSIIKEAELVQSTKDYIEKNADSWDKIAHQAEPVLDKSASVLAKYNTISEVFAMMRHFDEVMDFMTTIKVKYKTMTNEQLKESVMEVMKHITDIQRFLGMFQDRPESADAKKAVAKIKSDCYIAVGGLLQLLGKNLKEGLEEFALIRLNFTEDKEAVKNFLRKYYSTSGVDKTADAGFLKIYMQKPVEATVNKFKDHFAIRSIEFISGNKEVFNQLKKLLPSNKFLESKLNEGTVAAVFYHNEDGKETVVKTFPNKADAQKFVDQKNKEIEKTGNIDQEYYYVEA